MARSARVGGQHLDRNDEDLPPLVRTRLGHRSGDQWGSIPRVCPTQFPPQPISVGHIGGLGLPKPVEKFLGQRGVPAPVLSGRQQSHADARHDASLG